MDAETLGELGERQKRFGVHKTFHLEKEESFNADINIYYNNAIKYKWLLLFPVSAVWQMLSSDFPESAHLLLSLVEAEEKWFNTEMK